MLLVQFLLVTLMNILFISCCDRITESCVHCPYLKLSASLNVYELVGSWLTVYTKPKSIDCFTLHIRATSDLERDRYASKYGNFSGRVNWNMCLLEVESPTGQHFLQGSGENNGLLENVIIQRTPSSRNGYIIQEQTPDQWLMFGRRGREILVMRDCLGEAYAAFARAPYWPTIKELYATLHRSGIAPMSKGRVLCEPRDFPTSTSSITRHRYLVN